MVSALLTKKSLNLFNWKLKTIEIYLESRARYAEEISIFVDFQMKAKYRANFCGKLYIPIKKNENFTGLIVHKKKQPNVCSNHLENKELLHQSVRETK